MGAGYEFLQFKQNYYEALSTDQKEKVRHILLKMLGPDYAWSPGIERAAYVCADLEIEDAYPLVKKILADWASEVPPIFIKDALYFFELDFPKHLKCMFTDIPGRKSEEDFERFGELYSALPSDQQICIRQSLLALMRQSPPEHGLFSIRAVLIYARIKPEEAKIEVVRMKADPHWQEKIDFIKGVEKKIFEK
ncbi:hypothetical protein JYT87_01990 [Nitrospira defluvii]|nr:hypothetical protein [Nitrospira defluvii]